MRFKITLRYDAPYVLTLSEKARFYAEKSYTEIEDAIIDGKEAASVLNWHIRVFDTQHNYQTHEIDPRGMLTYL
jgi:hypothetical protein